MKIWPILLCVPMGVWASECVLQDRTVTQSQGKIQQRSSINQTVVNLPSGERRCIVEFRVQINNQWHTAHGQYDWPGDRPREEACAVAVDRAQDAVLTYSQPLHLRSEKVLVCSDRADSQLVRSTNPGTVAADHQFRPHPNYPRRFWHNGTECRWFLESSFRQGDIYNYQGIICKIHNNQWVVVDKF